MRPDYAGQFLAKGSVLRAVRTNFPIQISEQEVVDSAVATMQHAASKIDADPELLRVLQRTAVNLVQLHYVADVEGRLGVQSTAEIPINLAAHRQSGNP